MHQHVPVPGRSLGLCHRAGDPIGHIPHQRIVRHRGTVRPMTDHEDRDTVTITAPVIDLLRSTPTRQHRAVRVHLVEQLPGGPDGRPYSPSGVVIHSCSRSKPSPPGLPGASFGPAMYPSSDIDMKSTDADTWTSCAGFTLLPSPPGG